MKERINKYFSFIGVKDEGVKRLLLVIIVISSVLSPNLQYGWDLEDYYELFMWYDENYDEIIRFYWSFFFQSLFIVGVVSKTYYWVKEGFNQS